MGKSLLRSSHSPMGASHRHIGGICPCSRSGYSDCRRCHPDSVFGAPCDPMSGLTAIVQRAERHGGSPATELCTRESCSCTLGPPFRDNSTFLDACRLTRPRPQRSCLPHARKSRSVTIRKIFHIADVSPSVRVGALSAESVVPARCNASPCIVHTHRSTTNVAAPPGCP